VGFNKLIGRTKLLRTVEELKVCSQRTSPKKFSDFDVLGDIKIRNNYIVLYELSIKVFSCKNLFNDILLKKNFII
jgi:hypothetical protein